MSRFAGRWRTIDSRADTLSANGVVEDACTQPIGGFWSLSPSWIARMGILAHPAVAQERPGPVAELAAGALVFPGATVRERFAGGAWRFYVSPRVSVGPEVAYIRGYRHTHLMLTGNLTFDLTGPVNGQSPPVTPFVVVGAGLLRTREEFPGRGDFTSREGAFTAGGGVRANVGKRVTVGAEARIGWELHLRMNAMVGVRLGGP